MRVLRGWFPGIVPMSLTFPGPSDPLTAVFGHPAFEPGNVPAADLAKMLETCPSEAVTLYVLLLWVSHDHEEGGLPAMSLELASIANACAAKAVGRGAAWLKKVQQAFPSVFHLVITPNHWLPRMASLERDLEVERCVRCHNLVPSKLRDEEDACFYLEHTGDYKQHHGWSCCSALRKKSEGCTLKRGDHYFR